MMRESYGSIAGFPAEAAREPAMLTKIVSTFLAHPKSGTKDLAVLQAALDVVDVGIVLLNRDLEATYINPAFRRLWKLPDEKADSRPPFVALMYHGRDTGAYELNGENLNTYVARRVAQLKVGDPDPLDIRLNSGEVVRYQCTVLPEGRRMLTYTYVTDIVRHGDDLELFRSALDGAEEGILILDRDLRAQFMNRSLRKLWGLSDELADSKPRYSDLVGDARFSGAYGISPEELEKYIAERIKWARQGNSAPVDIRLGDGRIIRARCSVLPNNARMLTYNEITDLVRHAEQLQLLATVDSLTGVYNRRQFFALASIEWDRFKRYYRPLSALVIDIDVFKTVNDTYGHEAGDRAIIQLTRICEQVKRQSDILARMGGEEFIILLPETDQAQAMLAAERLRQAIAETPIWISKDASIKITISVGVAEANASMPAVGTLINLADEALYSAKAAGRNQVALGARKQEDIANAAE